MTAMLNRGIKKSPVDAIVKFELAHCLVLLYNSVQVSVAKSKKLSLIQFFFQKDVSFLV